MTVEDVVGQLRDLWSGEAEGARFARRLVKGAAGTAGLHVTAIGLAFVTSVVLARVMGPEGYGAYSYAISLLYLLGVPAILGFDQLVIREVSSYRTSSRHSLAAGLLDRADQLVLLFSVGLAAAGWAVSRFLLEDPDPLMLVTFWTVLPALPLLSLLRVRRAALQGLQKVVRGQFPETVIHPTAFLAAVGVVLLLPDAELDPVLAVALNVAGFAVALVWAACLLRVHLPESVRTASPDYETRAWLSAAVPLLFVASLQVINSRTDVIMLGAFRGAEPVGIYNVASRGAEFVTFFMMAANRSLAPTVAELHEEGDRERLQRLVTTVARVVLGLSLPVALTFFLFGDSILGWVYGDAFREGHAALAVLSAAHLGNVAAGSVTVLLMMTGHERDAAVGVGIGAALNVTLNALFIPLWGLLGAAVATGISLVAWNVVFAVMVHRRLDIHPTALGRLG
jgi:O-antigen/teichoic acid export membrane protein